jgi:hypothetical protein
MLKLCFLNFHFVVHHLITEYLKVLWIHNNWTHNKIPNHGFNVKIPHAFVCFMISIPSWVSCQLEFLFCYKLISQLIYAGGNSNDINFRNPFYSLLSSCSIFCWNSYFHPSGRALIFVARLIVSMLSAWSLVI